MDRAISMDIAERKTYEKSTPEVNNDSEGDAFQIKRKAPERTYSLKWILKICKKFLAKLNLKLWTLFEK